jgi:hypothetical protein
MNRETLRNYLHNGPLVQAIDQKRSIDKTKQELLSAIQTLRETGIRDSLIDEVQGKYEEYQKISSHYGTLIEDAWNVSWQNESIIKRYIDCLDDDIDRLPDEIK